MSIFDELQQAAAKQDPVEKIRAQIQALRDQSKAAFNAQFVMGSENNEQSSFLQGRLEAFDECLQLFGDVSANAEPQGSRKWTEEE